MTREFIKPVIELEEEESKEDDDSEEGEEDAED
jgi:hypothetical protein